jgi:hypothetical protein
LTLQLDETLQRAEILFHQFKQRLASVDDKREALKKDIKEYPGDAEHAKDELDKLPRINVMIRGLLNNAIAPAEPSRSRSSSLFSEDAKLRDDDSFVHLDKASNASN